MSVTSTKPPNNGVFVFLKRFYDLPAKAASRIIALLLSLITIKLLMLFSLRKYLFEIHYRIGPEGFTWINYAAFYMFVLIVASSIVCLQRHNRFSDGGDVDDQAINWTIIALGLAFILLTYHYVPENLTGASLFRRAEHITLSMVPLFFQEMPYLGIWLIGYLFIHTLLIRFRYHFAVPYLTASVVAVYAIVNLRWMEAYRNELFAINGFGFAFLFINRGLKTKWESLWLAIPLAWTFFAWLIFRFVESMTLPTAQLYSRLVIIDIIAIFGIATALSVLFGFYNKWVLAMPFYISAFWLLLSQNFDAVLNFDKLLYLGMELPRYFVDEFICVFIVATFTAAWVWFLPRDRLWALDVVTFIIILVSLVDLRLSQIMGVRLGWDILSFDNNPKMLWLMIRPYLPAFCGALALLVLLYLLLLKAIASLISLTYNDVSRTRSNGFLFVAFTCVVMGVTGLFTALSDKAEGSWPLTMLYDCPVWRQTITAPMAPAEFVNSAGKLGLVDCLQLQTTSNTAIRTNLNVLLIYMESSYNKHLSLFDSMENTEPLLSGYKGRMELFPNYFSDFPSSIHARFAAFTSLYPVKDYDAFTLRRISVKSIFEILHDNGYFCSLFYSSFFDYTDFRDFLRNRGLDEMFDADTMPGGRKTKPVSWGLREEETTRAICAEIGKMAHERTRFFLTYVPAAPHYPYDGIPQRFWKYTNAPPGDFEPLYLNEMLYEDWNMSMILDKLRDSGLLNKTLVVITDDHGEMLGENGGPVGHGWVVSPVLTNIPLIIMDPGDQHYSINYSIGSEVDLLPTILDRLGIEVPTDQLYEGRSLYQSTNVDRRLIYLDSFDQFGVIRGHQFIRGNGKTPDSIKFSYFNIVNATNRTLFVPVSASPGQIPPIREFDKFQLNFLRNYSEYCKEVYQIRTIYSEQRHAAADQ